MNNSVLLESELTCPECGYKKVEVMPTDACQWFYECENCQTLLKPKQGDCCVFCSYGEHHCAGKQEAALAAADASAEGAK